MTTTTTTLFTLVHICINKHWIHGLEFDLCSEVPFLSHCWKIAFFPASVSQPSRI